MTKVLVNATSLGSRPSGARNRFESIYPWLFREHQEVKFTLLVSKDYLLPREINTINNVRLVRLPFGSDNRILRRVLLASIPLVSVAFPRFDAIDDLSLPPTFFRSKNRFVTIHDIRRFENPTSFASQYAFAFSLKLCRVLGCTVITVSEEMARSLSRYYPAKKIRVIENTVPTGFLANGTDSNTNTEVSSFSTPFILTVGHLEVRKNYERLIKAFDILAQNRSDLRLVIVGRDSGSEERIRALVAELGLETRLDILTDISDAKLLELYKSARALVFPSVYEGFGIPLLEAMAVSCPMAVSDIPVFHEIAEDAAVYFDPYDVEGMAMAISRLLQSEDLCRDLSARGSILLRKYHAPDLAARLGTFYFPPCESEVRNSDRFTKGETR